MLNGDVFSQQYFPAGTFALFMNTFLNGKCGIIEGYKNSMKLDFSNNSITISSGAICIKGRFLREDSSTTIPVKSNSTLFCKLVIEIDLGKNNTKTEFHQGYYKIVTSESEYPNLTQNDIVNTESGVYQYELAKFKVNLNGITDFEDTREFIDFNSIYKEIEKHIQEIDNGSAFLLKSDLESIEKELKKSFDDKSTDIDKKIAGITSYSDFIIEHHTVPWNGGQVSNSTRVANSKNTIQKAGYYPIGVCNVVSTDMSKTYFLADQSDKKAGSMSVTFRYLNDGASIAANDMPSAVVVAAWVKIT